MVKTMVFDIDKGATQEPIFVLQHGNKKVDTKRLAMAVAGFRLVCFCCFGIRGAVARNFSTRAPMTLRLASSATT